MKPRLLLLLPAIAILYLSMGCIVPDGGGRRDHNHEGEHDRGHDDHGHDDHGHEGGHEHDH